MARFNPIKGGTEPPAKPAKASRKKPKAAPPPPFRKSGSDHAKPPLTGGISSADFLAMLKAEPCETKPRETADEGGEDAGALNVGGLTRSPKSQKIAKVEHDFMRVTAMFPPRPIGESS